MSEAGSIRSVDREPLSSKQATATAATISTDPVSNGLKDHSPGKVLPTQPSESSFDPLAGGKGLLSRNGSGNMLRRRTTMDFDDYFVGPRDPNKHSKSPYFLRLHGSVLPKLILPLLFIGGWATAITLISKYVHSLGIDSLLLTVLGFVVGLSLSFRSSTAYERYAEGRKYWAQLIVTSRNFARLLWIHASERPGDDGKEDLIAKLTGLNLIIAYAISLKHKLRFEPYTDYDDLKYYVGHLQTFAKSATITKSSDDKKKATWKAIGEYLGVSFAESNPRKALKKAKSPLGHLPLEIMNHLSSYLENLIQNGTLKTPIMQTHAVNYLATMNEVLTGTERILATPLPLAYSISIAQITWLYVLILPFQLYPRLDWITIPGTLVAAYIILGIAAIGREIENPFGNDVNDLPLEAYCEQVAAEISIITAMPPQKMSDFINHSENLIMYPLSSAGYSEWKNKSVEEIRAALRNRSVISCANIPNDQAQQKIDTMNEKLEA